VDAEEKKLYVKLAYGYYQNKEYKKAIDLYEKLYQSDADDVNVLNMLSDAYTKAGNNLKALDASVLALNIYEKKSQYDKVIKLVKKVLKHFPDEQRVKNKLKSAMRTMMRDAEKKIMLNEFDGAREILENLKEFNSDEYPINLRIKELNDAEARQKALKFKKLEQESGDRPGQGTGNDLVDKFDRMAQNYLDNGDYDGAVETYITALKLSPNNQLLRDKLHKVYSTVSQKNSGERIWEKIENSPSARLEEAKRRAIEDRQKKIMEEEEARARLLLEEEARIQREYEEMELDIIQKAADELKNKLDEAQKKEKLKEEEIQRIMAEQEEKKKALLEKIKREAIEKWNKQKEAIQKQVADMKAEETAAEEKEKIQEQPESKNIFDALKGAYAMPEISKPAEETAREAEARKEIPFEETAQPETEKKGMARLEEILSSPDQNIKDDIDVNEDTLDSLITTAYIYINQNLLKEALHIFNRVSEKYPENPEVKQILVDITKRQESL
jgi:tetratricopeptide (TPR) repeat protein